MRRLFFIVVLLAIWIEGYAVKVETTTNLKVYYPEYTKIDLVCEEMPKAAQKDVEFCCEAAFTGELLTEFKHSNIGDNHICNGVMKKGYSCKANTGGFVWGKGKWKFMRKADYPTTADGWNMGFCQMLIVKDGSARPIGAKMKNNVNIYRALWAEVGTPLGIEIRRERSLCFSQRAKWLPVTSLEPIGLHFINEHHIKHSIG